MSQDAEEELKRFKDGRERGIGLLHRNDSVDQASWADMFRGDSITNFNTIEIANFQMFMFTIAVIITYAAMLFTLMQNGDVLRNPLSVDLPLFSSSLNYLLVISHAGYLTTKYSPSS